MARKFTQAELSKGGKRRAKKLTAAQRQAIASKAATERWRKWREAGNVSKRKRKTPQNHQGVVAA